MPGDDRREGQRALAQPVDHHVAAGFDPLGDGDLALTRQQFDAAHLAQIHAHGIVGAAQACLIDVAGLLFLGLFLGLFHLGDGNIAFLVLLALDDLDAHFREIGHHVFDLFGAVLVRRQNRVQLVEGDVAAFLAFRDQPLNAGRGHVQQGCFGILLRRGGVAGDHGLRGHRSENSFIRRAVTRARRDPIPIEHRQIRPRRVHRYEFSPMPRPALSADAMSPASGSGLPLLRPKRLPRVDSSSLRKPKICHHPSSASAGIASDEAHAGRGIGAAARLHTARHAQIQIS